MKINDINKMFTERVAHYIAKGYTINVETMSGSQGEVGKVDLVKDDELIRVWLNKEANFRGDLNRWTGYALVLRVSRWEHPASSHRTVWNSELTTIDINTYYEIAQGEWYIEDEEEAVKIQEERRSRYRRRDDFRTTPDMDDERRTLLGYRFLKRKVGYKRVTIDDVKVRKIVHHTGKRITYYVLYKGNRYVMN